MAISIEQGYARIVAARQRMLDLRGERIEQLLRFRTFLRTRLGDFVSTMDPVTGVRMVEISAEGSKAHGDLALTAAFFDGSKLRLSVDSQGRYGGSATPADLFAPIEIFDLRVSADCTRAEIDIATDEAPATRRTEDLAVVVARILEHAVLAVEAEVGEAPQREIGFAGRTRGGLSFSVR